MYRVLELVHRWQWLIAAIGAAIAAPILYAPRRILEEWDWHIHRWRDEPILRTMRDLKTVPPKHNLPLEKQLGPSHVPMTPNILIIKEGTYSVGDLSHILNRTHRSIGKSLRRLKAKGKVEVHKGGFRLTK
jgi:hypothetical protein